MARNGCVRQIEGGASNRVTREEERTLRRAANALLFACILILAPPPVSAESVIRIGVLKFGTVNWELDVIAHHGLDRAAGIRVEPVELAGTPATQVALQAGQVDAIVSDWLWVSRQRRSGADWTFAPFSSAVGALMVPEESPIRSLTDLKGRHLGIAGSPIDKSWLILRLAALKNDGFDLEKESSQAFGAPPLLDEQLKSGRLDGVLTYWPFAARLEAQGMRRVVSVGDAIRRLGIATKIPLVGYVMSEHWAKSNAATVEGFLRARRQAGEILDRSDEEWRRIAPLTGARNEAELASLRDDFRAGIPRHWGDRERADVARLYELLATIGGEALVGPSRTLEPGTLLDDDRF